MDEEKEYHIGIAKGMIPERVLLPGDPQRAKMIAENYFDDCQEIAHKREYWSFKGSYNGKEVAVCSTGIGCPSAAIAMEELIRVGCRVFIRVGTAGAIDSSLESGDVVIFTGSVREDGTSIQYVPIEFPAVPDPNLVMSLKKAAENYDVRYRLGIGHSKDAFYSEYPQMMANPAEIEIKWQAYRRAKVLATEMESSVLFVIGQLREVSTATICTVIGEPIEDHVKITKLPSIDNMIKIALDAITEY